jgi:hypothetical protein
MVGFLYPIEKAGRCSLSAACRREGWGEVVIIFL